MTPTDVAERIETVRMGEIMIPLDEYPKISPKATLRDAIQVLEQAQLEVGGRKSLPRALLVIDQANQLEGCVRRRDIIGGLEPKFLVTQPLDYRKKLFDVSIDPNLTELSNQRLVKGIREQAQRPVSEVMRRIEVTLDYNDNIIKAVYEMISHGLNLLPVLKDGKVVGVVRSVELFGEMANVVLTSQPEPNE